MPLSLPRPTDGRLVGWAWGRDAGALAVGPVAWVPEARLGRIRLPAVYRRAIDATG